MAALHKSTPQQILVPTDELKVRYSGENADKSAAAFKELPVSLPGKGDYLVRLEGHSLHISEISGGITTYDITDRRQAGAPQIENGSITIPLRTGTAINRVVLHTTKARDDKDAVPENAIPALPLINEFRELSSRASSIDNPLTAEDKLRMAELVRQIQSVCKETHGKPEKKSAPGRKEQDNDADERLETARKLWEKAYKKQAIPAQPTRTTSSQPSSGSSTPGYRNSWDSSSSRSSESAASSSSRESVSSPYSRTAG